jgi:uncharacterized damage-inducible protein DinB
MTPEEIRQHIFYSSWASRKLLDAAAELSEEQRNQDFGVAHQSLKGTLDHIFFGDRIWFARAVDPRVMGMEMGWPQMMKRWEDWATAVSHQDIVKNIDYKDLKGAPRRTPMWQIVLHVVNHATLHRGQVQSMLRQLGVAPPQTDLITYYREIKVT